MSRQTSSHSAWRNRRGGAPVGHYFHIPVRHQYIDEYAVAKFGVPEVQIRKGLQRPVARRQPGPQVRAIQRGFDHEADLAAGARLGGDDRRLDRLQHRGGNRRRVPAREATR